MNCRIGSSGAAEAHLDIEAEVAKALGKLKNGEAPCSSNFLPEMLKAMRGAGYFTGLITGLIDTIWEERRVPRNRLMPSSFPSQRHI